MGQRQSKYMKHRYDARYSDNKKNRIMFTVTRTENCLVLKTKTMNDEYGQRFYIPMTQIEIFLANDYLIDQDIRSFVKLSRMPNSEDINICFTWLESNGHTVKGAEQYFTIQYEQFAEFCENSVVDDHYTVLNTPDKVRNELVFSDSGRDMLKTILDAPKMKKKLSKALQRMQYGAGRKTTFHSDYSPYSFFWQGSDGVCGGLIWHRNGKENERSREEGYYGVHT